VFRSFESVLDECLAAVRSGEPVQACLERYPRYADRLRPLLQLADRISKAPLASPRAAAQARAWQAVQRRAADLRAGKRQLPQVPSIGGGAWLRPIAAVLALFLGIGAAGTGTVLAAQNSLPDSPLYRVKLASEDARLWFVFDDKREAEILLDQSNERTREIREMVAKGKEVPAVVLSALEDRNERASAIISENRDAASLVEELKSQAQQQEMLLVRISTEVERSATDDYADTLAAVHNARFTGAVSFTRLLSEDVAGGVLTVSGVAEQVEGQWTLGGVPVGIDQRTLGSAELTPGASADFVIAVGQQGRWHALSVSRVQVGPASSNAFVSGAIEEVTDDHIVIAGQAIPITRDTVVKLPLRKGTRVSVKLDQSQTGLVAGSVSAQHGPEEGDQTAFTYEGTISETLDESSDALTIGGLRFALTHETSYDFPAGARAVAGVRARVDAIVSDDDGFEALKIMVLAADGAPDDVFIIGTVESADPNEWTVSGIDMDAAPGTPPAQGDTIAVAASLVNTAIVANSYHTVESEQTGDLTRLEGTITKIDETSWEGFGRELRVDSKARLSGRPIEGARAIVWGRNDPESGGFKAVYVRILDQRPVVPPPESQDDSGEDDDSDDD
jgi:hypothetical protein